MLSEVFAVFLGVVLIQASVKAQSVDGENNYYILYNLKVIIYTVDHLVLRNSHLVVLRNTSACIQQLRV